MKNKNLKILLASPRGFCAGVDRAIEIVKKSIDKYGSPVYVRHEIVHNKHVVDSLKKIGAVFVEEIEEIKDKTRPVIFSAHGVPKSVPKEASALNMTYVMQHVLWFLKFTEKLKIYIKMVLIYHLLDTKIIQRWLEQWVNYQVNA